MFDRLAKLKNIAQQAEFTQQSFEKRQKHLMLESNKKMLDEKRFVMWSSGQALCLISNLRVYDHCLKA